VSEGEQTSSLLSSLKAFIVAPLIFIIILGAIFAYSGIWPPLVVIESKSMQHDAYQASDYVGPSSIGAIDTGDIVIVKEVNGLGDVVTYVEGATSGFETYGEYGDVVIYYKSGMAKPIIHRAIVELEYNETGGGFDVPSLLDLPDDAWSVSPGPQQVWNLQGFLILYDVGYAEVTVSIDLNAMLDTMGSNAHGGLITMGDNNWYTNNQGGNIGRYDQGFLSVKEPIEGDWVIGKARGELPWFGLLKLWFTGTAPEYTPPNSQTNLFITLGVVIGVPIVLDTANTLLKKRGVHMFGWTGKLSTRRLWTRLKGKR
jgi:signal peptidase